MSTTLASIRTEIVDAVQIAVPNLANIYDHDPREAKNFLSKLKSGNSIRAWLLADLNPSASARIDSSDYTANALIVGLRSVAKGAKVKAQDEAQLVVRRLRAIAHNRSAVVVSIETVQVGGRYPCYQTVINAQFYALQTIA